MPRACCCYAIDPGYLLPTILSAMQLRESLSQSLADVLIVCFGRRSASTDAAQAHCREKGVLFHLVAEEELAGSPMICARFFLARHLDSSYEEIIYIDGDTQIPGELESLVSFPLGSGKILAAPDPMSILIDSQDGPWPARRAYFHSIGMGDDQIRNYFNSGVLRFWRSDWDDISRECIKLCRHQQNAFKFLDQDALNLVVGGNRDPISFRWNYPSFLMNFEEDIMIRPCIYHFMSRPRPWDGPFLPWGRRWHEPYLRLACVLPDLSRFNRPLRGAKYMRYVGQQWYKRLTESFAWRQQAVLARIQAMEAEAVV